MLHRPNRWWSEIDSTDAKLALEAAQQTANRLGEPVVVQVDLSVVPQKQATQEVLELVHPE
jgi:sulfur carrier protein ThiS